MEKDQKEELETKLSTPLMIMSTINNEETANKIKEQMTANMPENQKQIFQNMSLIDILKNTPEEQRNQMMDQFTGKIKDMSDSIRTQAAISSVKEVYKNLGIDTDKIQNDYIWKTGMQMLGIASITMI